MQHPSELKISDFTYDLPQQHIALYPPALRGSSRLLREKDGAIYDHAFSELPELLAEGSILLCNNTKVVPARLYLYRQTGARVELLCLRPANEQEGWDKALQRTGSGAWVCMTGNAKRWGNDPLTLVGDGLFLQALKSPGIGEERYVEFHWKPEALSFGEILQRAGQMPIPPYLKREAEPIDRQRYQTHYARSSGSVAAPTAGLHFTPELWSRLDEKGIKRLELTLHVGAGTFKPVTAPTMGGHAMHSEELTVERALLQQLAEQIQLPKTHRKPLVCVGTTTLRSLESLYWMGALLHEDDDDLPSPQAFTPYDHDKGGTSPLPDPYKALTRLLQWLDNRGLQEWKARTALMIAPGYRFRLADQLITNFHQPGSTLLLLVAAVVGERWRDIYEHALKNDYRFLSYGDSSLLNIQPNHQWNTH